MSNLKIYDGELRFDAGEHKYTWNGTPVPGVTTVLKQLNKPALIQWSASFCGEHILNNYRVGMSVNDMQLLCREGSVAHNKARDKAATIGTKVHSYVEAVMKGKERPTLHDEAALASAQAFEDWHKQQKIERVLSEQILFSKNHWYAGTSDIIGMVNGRMTVADIKTSSGIFPEMFMQLGAYTNALEEMDPDIKISQWIIIRLDKKTGKFQAKRMTRNSLYIDAFLRCRELHKCMSLIEELKHEHMETTRSKPTLVKPARARAAKAAKGDQGQLPDTLPQ